MGLGLGGLQSGGTVNASTVIPALVGQNIVANSITLTANAVAERFFTSLTGATGTVYGTSAALGMGMDTGSASLIFFSASTEQWRLSGTTGDLDGNSAFRGVRCFGYRLGTKTQFARDNAPTIVAGAGASVAASNGTIAFRLDLGGAAGTGTVTLPTATTGWVLYMQDITNPAATVLSQTGGNTTTATFASYDRTTGLAANWAANDIAVCIAVAY